MAMLKRQLAPKFWKIRKKESRLIVSPRPGPHKKFESIPLLIVLRDLLKLCENSSEAKKIINSGEILVDGKKRKDYGYSVGLMDAISIPKLNKCFRVVPTENGLELIEITKKESEVKICRIKNKKTLRGGKVQLNLNDGRCILLDKDVYKTGDSLLIELPNQKIDKHLSLEKGVLGLIIKGKNSGKLVEIKEPVETRGLEPKKLICEIDKKPIEVLKDYVLVVGEDKPLIKISG